jgi:HK97 gp10 family phage protein
VLPPKTSMVGQVKVKFEGGREIEAALKDLGDQGAAKRTAMRALQLAAEPIRDRWEELAPIDDGDLKASIKIGRAIKAFQKRSSGDVVMTFIGIDESVNAKLHIYAEANEFGTSSITAQPAGRPAWEMEQMTAFNRLREELWSEIDKTSKRLAKRRVKKGIV